MKPSNKENSRILFLDEHNLASLVEQYEFIFVITHLKIEKLITKSYFFNFKYIPIAISEGENSKDFKTIDEIINKLSDHGCNRKSLIIGLGGGVISDITGFVATIFMRGIDHILIPTTLLSMVDASIGGKTGINYLKRKNLIGTFKQPKNIYLDLSFLNSLSEKELLNGFAEIIKYSLIFDRKLNLLMLLKLTRNFQAFHD